MSEVTAQRANFGDVVWQRYWFPVGKPIHSGLDGDEFLPNPEDIFGRSLNAELKTLAALLDAAPAVILCGEPGIGKSTELRTWQAARLSCKVEGDDDCWISFREIADFADFRRRTSESEAWTRWRDGGGYFTLTVDGVDEGLLRVPTFVTQLTALIRTEPLERLRIRLVCRTAEWQFAAGAELLSLWGVDAEAERVWELCPLRRKDAWLAAEQRGVDPQVFMRALRERALTPMASRPVTLFFLLKEFTRNRSLPGTHREIYELGCRQLADEHDVVRAEMLRALRRGGRATTGEERLGAARHLAALLLLAGKSAVYVPERAFDTSSTTNDLLLADAADVSLLANDVFRDALETGLFTSVGERRFGFTHQTYAECLAAQRLASLPAVQLRQLLCTRDGRTTHVVPQLAELAAWVAGTHTEFCEYLLRIEPEVLLRSDMTRLQSSRKEALVAALLDRAGRDEFADENAHRAFFSGLKHPRLVEQLRAVILNPEAHWSAHRLALDIAGRCRLAELSDDLLTLAKDPTAPIYLRESAAEALDDVLPDERLAELEPLARGEVGPDPDDRLRAVALGRLVPARWAVRDALLYLTPETNSQFIGGYHMMLRQSLPDLVRLEDVSAVFGDGPASYHPERRPHLYHLADAAFALGLDHLHDQTLRTVLVGVWRAWQAVYQGPLGDGEARTHKKLVADPVLRHRFVVALLNDRETTKEQIFQLCLSVQEKLVAADDLRWTLEQLNVVPAGRLEVWSELTSWLLNPEAVCPHWDFFLTQRERYPELLKATEWLRPMVITDPATRKVKANWLRDERRKRRWQNRDRNRPSAEQLVAADFQALRTGPHISRWVSLCYHLSLKPGDPHLLPLKHDITQYPGWGILDEVAQAEVRHFGREFLLRLHDDIEKFDGPTNYTDPAYVAAWLWRERIEDDSELRQAIVENWMDSLVLYFDSDKEHTQATFALLYRISPERAIAALLRAAKAEAKRHNYIFAFRRAKLCWDVHLSQAAAGFLYSLSKPEPLEHGLTELADRDALTAARCALELIRRGRHATTGECARLLAPALTAGLLIDPVSVWPHARTLLNTNARLAETVFLRLCDAAHGPGAKVLTHLDEPTMAELYQLLCHVLPPETDPPRESGFVSPRQSVSQVRGDLIRALAALPTEAACRELLRLAEARPQDASWLRRLHQNTLRAKRQATWEAPAVADVAALLSRSDARFVRDADELLAAALESLERLQTHLNQRTLPAVEELWQWDGAGNRRRNFRPKDEEFLSDYVARWLATDLGPARGVVVQREVQPRRGKRTDVWLEAVPAAADSQRVGEPTLTVVIEVKGCWNPEVRTAVDEQLVADYLIPFGNTHGIYLVGWFPQRDWTKKRAGSKNQFKARTLSEIVVEVEELCTPFDGQKSSCRVAGCVLNAALTTS